MLLRSVQRWGYILSKIGDLQISQISKFAIFKTPEFEIKKEIKIHVLFSPFDNQPSVKSVSII